MIEKEDVIYYENLKDFRDAVLDDVLKMFVERVSLVYIRLKKKFPERIVKSSLHKKNKIAISSTIDFEAKEIVRILIKGKVLELKRISPVENQKSKIIIKPLYLFLDKEVLLYAKLKKLKFKKSKPENDDISLFIDELEETHPEIQRAVVNSFLKLYSQK